MTRVDGGAVRVEHNDNRTAERRVVRGDRSVSRFVVGDFHAPSLTPESRQRKLGGETITVSFEDCIDGVT